MYKAVLIKFKNGYHAFIMQASIYPCTNLLIQTVYTNSLGRYTFVQYEAGIFVVENFLKLKV